MKLDSRVKSGYRPLTCFDTDEALKYIGRSCYFSTQIEVFNVLDDCDFGILEDVLDPSCEPFQKEQPEWYPFIIPAEWCELESDLERSSELEDY